MVTKNATVTVKDPNGLFAQQAISYDVQDSIPSGTIPLAYEDSRFASNTPLSQGAIPNGATISKKSYDSFSTGDSTLSSYGGGTFTLDTVRIRSRECIRIGAGGTVVINNTYLEAKGQGADHADAIQCYAPGATADVTIKNTAMRTYKNASTTACLFVADEFKGKFRLENVAFLDGPYGPRIHADAGCTIELWFKDVFYVNTGHLIRPEGSGKMFIRQWQNVRLATIVNGVLVPGAAVPSPYAVTP